MTGVGIAAQLETQTRISDYHSAVHENQHFQWRTSHALRIDAECNKQMSMTTHQLPHAATAPVIMSAMCVSV